ncbi:MAG: DUF4433 domain-containing protein [Limnospira sp. PMC 737.11]|nr:DUF4433 domain-containing protein [Limnospira sp. PMC 737.11]MDT9273940.1 DUF4433 domain-containing protein [Limnospira sp. PMC 737.11]
MTTYIYHITHLKNLPSILRSEGLLANNRLKSQRINYVDIAHETIQDKRAQINIPCSRGGTLHDYVPWYFAPRSPMLYAISRGNVQGYEQGQSPVIHLVATAEDIAAASLPFAFTDGHAIVRYSEFYDNLDSLNAIDWEIMNARYWADTPEDGDRKRRRQAEFLVYEFFPWTLVREIGVIDAGRKAEVEEILQNFTISTPVKVFREWYY